MGMYASSLHGQVDSPSPRKPTLDSLVVAQLTVDTLTLTIKATYAITETVPNPYEYFVPECLCVLSDSDHRPLDSLDEVSADCRDSMRFVDHRNQLNWGRPLFSIRSIGNSDMTSDQFIEIRDNKMTTLFTIVELIEISRPSDSLITGMIRGRDVVVYNFYECPFEVTIPSFEVKYLPPDEIKISFESSVLDVVDGYQVVDGKHVPVRLPIGTRIIVDTFYQKTGLVRLLLDDGTVIFIDRVALEGKIVVNVAG